MMRIWAPISQPTLIFTLAKAAARKPAAPKRAKKAAPKRVRKTAAKKGGKKAARRPAKKAAAAPAKWLHSE